MDKKIKAEWVKALRSGKYRQGRGTLREEDDFGNIRYCCLGVLCEITNTDIRKGQKYIPRKLARKIGIGVRGEIPNAPRMAFGKDGGGRYGITLAEFNDDTLSFKRIANLIEKYL